MGGWEEERKRQKGIGWPLARRAPATCRLLWEVGGWVEEEGKEEIEEEEEEVGR